MKKFLLVVVLLGLVCAAFIYIRATRLQETASEKQEFAQSEVNSVHSDETEKLQTIARLCGVSEKDIQEGDMYMLLFQIENKLRNKRSYYEDYLTDEEMKILQSSFREGAPLILKIESYHRYLKSLEGKDVILLPKQ